MPFRALVVGGSGGMGRWCACLLKRAGFQTCISSRRDATATAESMGVGVASQGDSGQFDVVVLAVPLDSINAVAADVGPRMKPGSLLMDLCSLKKGPMAALQKYAPSGVDVIGAHPLFGPGLDAIDGRTIVLVPTDRSERWLPIIKDIFESAGARLTIASAEEHDRKMAVVQGLTHFMYIGWAAAIEALDVSPDDLEGFQTPVYSITKDLAGRVLSQSPELYALIQSGDEVPRVRNTFLESCRDLSDMAASGDINGFMESFRSAAAHYGDTVGARMRSERLIRRDIHDIASLRDDHGAERAFLLPGGRQVYGIIKEVRREDFTLETPSETLVLRYDAVTPLGPEWLIRLKSGLSSIGRDILVKLPIGADAMVLRWVLLRIEGVAGVEVETHDALSPDYVVFRFTIDVSPERSEETLQKVLMTIWGLGFEVK